VWYYSKQEDYTFFGTLSNIQSDKYQCGKTSLNLWL
jgi:hypothetical protein